MRIAHWILTAGLTGLVATNATGQDSTNMPESYRLVQAKALELQRRMLVAMVDSMPEHLYRDRPRQNSATSPSRLTMPQAPSSSFSPALPVRPGQPADRIRPSTSMPGTGFAVM